MNTNRIPLSRRFAQIASRKSSIGPFSAATTDYSPELATIGVSDFASVKIPKREPQENPPTDGTNPIDQNQKIFVYME
jgi:hypothetical protein